MKGKPGRKSKMVRAGLIALCLHLGILGFSVTGSLILSLVPHKAPSWDYDVLATWLAQANILTGSLVAALALMASQGAYSAALLAGLCILVAGGAELMSTVTGFPFGYYVYSDRLGPKFLDLVPYAIPVAWFMMLAPCLLIADAIRLGVLEGSVLAACMMTLWDTLLDPVMTTGFSAWQWLDGGGPYGIPWRNFVAWFAVALVVAAIHRSLLHGRASRHGLGIAVTLYGAQSLFAGAMALLNDRSLAVAVWLLGVGALALYLNQRPSGRSNKDSRTERPQAQASSSP